MAPDGSRFCPSCGRSLQGSGASDHPTVALDATHLDPRSLHRSHGVRGHDDTRALQAGTLLANRYRIIRQLGRGGMGVVYQADDLRLEHPVALKFLPASLAHDARRLEAFHREVSVARQITHPNVCRVYDIEDADGHLFLSMEYIEGEDLASALTRRGALPEREGIELARQVCAGLAAVHARGVLHRDLKPANIMIDRDGRPKLTDFGIASAGDWADAVEATEGTPAYMAPEQLAERKVTTASDIYALGLVLYEIFTGRRPFEAATLEELTKAQAEVLAAAHPDLSALAPRLREAVLACLSRDPDRRPASAEAVLGMLQVRLLDAEAHGRRVFQVLTQSAFGPLLGIGLLMIVSGSGGRMAAGLAAIAAALVLAAIEFRYPLQWSVDYKGHRIRFHNHPVFGERLYIDGVLADRGRFGFVVTLRGTIESGAGAGERITAEVRSSFTRMSCRIVAESFAPAAHRAAV